MDLEFINSYTRILFEDDYKGACNQRTQTDGFAEQNVRDAERAD